MAMTLRLSAEQTEQLRESAAREGISMHAMVLRAIDSYLSPRTATRDALLARIVAEDSAVLERLRDA